MVLDEHLQKKRRKTWNFLLLYMIMLLVTSLRGVSLSPYADRCAGPTTTAFDGFLDSHIAYAVFDRNRTTQVSLGYPFPNGAKEASVWLWLRLTRVAEVDGIVFECQGVIRLSMNGTRMLMTLNGAERLEAQVTDDLQDMFQWNSLAVSFKAGSQRIYFNGKLAAERKLPSTFSLNSGNQCRIGTGVIDSKNLISGHIRHFVISSQGLDSEQLAQTKIRSAPSPSDKNLLIYLKFDRDWKDSDSFYYRPGIKASNLQIEVSSETERVCYCTTLPQSVLRVNRDLKLRQQNFTSQQITQLSSSDGLTLSMLIYPLRFDSPDMQTSLFSISKYLELSVVNRSQSLRVDLSVGNSLRTLTFPRFRFRSQFWSLIRFSVTRTQVILNVDDGEHIEAYAHNITKLADAMPERASIPQQVNMQYLIHSVNISNTSGAIVWSQAFTQQKFDVKQWLESGRIIFQENNQMCTKQDRLYPQNFISESGDTCKDSFLYPRLTGDPAAQGVISGPLKLSSQTQMTLELWVKDLSSTSALNVTSVLLQFSTEISAPLLQLSIIPPTPQSNFTQRTIRLQPTTSTSRVLDFRPSSTTLASGRATFNRHWVHLAFIGTQNSITLVSYNLTSKVTETQSLLGASFIPQYSELIATIGSSRGGLNRFDGIIRELKVWQAARTKEEVSNYRFSSVVPLSKDILHYFRFSSGNEIYTFFDEITGRNLSTSGSFPLVIHDVDTGLTICKQGSFFNGQCCERLSQEGVGISLGYNPSKSNIIVSITAPQGAGRELLNSLVGNFSLVSLGFSNNGTLESQYKRLFTRNRSGTFSVSSTLVDPLAHNLTIQARIYSLFDEQGGAYTTVTQTLTLLCPNFYFLINNETDVFHEDDQFIVSSSAESFLTMEVRNVQNRSSPQCYDPVRAQVFNISVNEVRWSQQLSVPNSALTFDRMWNLTLNNTLASFRQVSMVSQRWVRVSVRVSFNLEMMSDININLTYSPVQPLSPQFPTSSIIRNYLTTDPITLDFSSFVSSDAISFPLLNYRALCPRSLFSSDFDHATYCMIDSDRRFTLPSQLRTNQVVSNLVYQFRFLIGVQGTNIVRTYSVNVTFYLDGTGSSLCPRVTWPQLDINKTDNRTQIMRPQAYLHCSGVFYEVTSVETLVADEKTNRAITGLILPGSETSMIYSRIPKDTLALKNLLAGSRLKVTQKLNLRQQNRTGIVQPVKTSSFSGTFSISVVKRPLEPEIFITNSRGETLSPLSIGFLETNFTLNATRSVDPDDLKSQLSFIWTCPSMISVDQCRRMQTGLRNSSLVFPMILKFNLGMLHDIEYNFLLMVGSIDNPYATNRTISFTIKFAGPNMNDSMTEELRPSQCEKLDLSSNSFVTKGSRKVIDFTKEDWASSSVSALQTFDNLSAASRSPCGDGQVEESYLLFYLFDGNPFWQYQLKTLIKQKSMPVPKLQTARVNSQDYPQILSAPSDVKLQGTFYLFSKRQGSTRLFLNLESFFLERKFADLVAKLEQDQLTLDQFQTLTLNATPSYDLENSTNRNFTYIWLCPRAEDSLSIPRACQTNSSILKVSYADRVVLGQSSPNQNYEYRVRVTSQGRESTQASAIVRVTSQESYSECIKIVEWLSVDLLSYNWQEYRVIGFQTGDQLGISYQISPTTKCETAEIQTVAWSTPSKYKIYDVDSANRNRINIYAGQSIQANSQDDITVRVQASLGGDKTNLHQKQQTLKIISRSPLIPIITGKTFFVYGEDGFISFRALQPESTVPLNCTWDCPASLGGPACFSGCLFNLSFPQLHYLSMKTSNQSLSTHFDTSLPFRVTITDILTQQEVSLTHTVYLLDSLTSPLYGLQNCQILSRQNSLLQSLASDVVLTLSCGSNETANQLLNAYDLVWEVVGLPKEAYYNQSRSVVIKAYAMSRLEGTEVKVGVRLARKGSGSRRMMEEYSEEQTASSIQEGGDSVELKTDTIEDKKPGDTGSGGQQNITIKESSIPARDFNDQNIRIGEVSELPQNESLSTNSSLQTTTSNSSNNQIPQFNSSDKIPLSFLRKETDRSLTTYFQFKRPILTQGKVSVTSSRSSSLEFYTTNLTFYFSGFNTTPPTIVMFQLRGLQSPLYNTFQILIAPKLFSQQTVDAFYRSTFIPEVSELRVDWFDLSGNYLGSQELLSQPSLQGLRMSGTMDFRAADRVIQTLQQKVSLGYMNEGEAAKNEFDTDMKRLMEVSEMLNSGLINIYGDETVIESLFQRIVQYLRANYKEMLNRYDQSNLFERKARLILQKRLILVFYNLLQRNKAQSSQILTVIDLFLVATDQIEQLLYESGEDPQFLIGVILWMQNNFRGQLESVKLPNKSLYFDRIYNITEAVNEADIKRSSQTANKVEQMRTQTQSRTIIKLNKASTQVLKIQNQNNQTETITFSGSEGRLAEVANISSLTVQYDALDLSQPSTAGTLTLVTIKGFTAQGQVAEISFPEDGDLYFQIELNLRPATNRTLNAPTRDNSTLRLGCSYFNIKMGTWDDKGMKLVAFDPKTLSLTCRAYHLTQFSAFIYKDLPNTASINQTVKINITQSTNQTLNQTKVPIMVKETDFEQDGYYVENRADYGNAIAIMFLIALGFNIVSILCCRYQNLVQGQPKPFKESTTFKPVDASLCQTFLATMIVFHPVLSSFWPQRCAALAIPRFIQLLQLQIHLYLVVLTSLFHLVYIEKTQVSYIQGISNIASYSVIQVAASWVLRPLFNRFKYGLYLQYAKVVEATGKDIAILEGYSTQRGSQNIERDSPENLSDLFTQTKTIQPSQRFVDGKESSSAFDYQYEGGESEESQESNQGSVERGHTLQATMGRPIQGRTVNPFEANNDHQQLESQSSEQYDLNTISLTNQDEEYKEEVGPSVLYDGRERQIKGLMKSSIINDLTGELSYQSNTNQTTPGGPPDQKEEKILKIQSTPFDQEFTANLKRTDSNVGLDQIELDLSEPDQSYASNQGSEIPSKHAQLTCKENRTAQIDLEKSREPRPSLDNLIARQTPALSLEDKIYMIESQQHLKGTRILLLILMISVLLGLMIAVIIIMQKVDDIESLKAWSKVSVGVNLIHLLILDTLACMAFSILFKNWKDISSIWMRVWSAALVNNFDIRSLISLNLELKQ